MALALEGVIGNVESYAATLLSMFWPAIAFAGGMLLAAWLIHMVLGFIMAVIKGV